ncbi:sulfite exporter TauE/SafE family protein [Paraburkholderia sp. SARCC-3016]|uniref:sulfite exporter TauE/SafE family protein n=1 Tax=Paraburkholderia sp. SARCC-3016 TaxID=3058611 RepID=UPI002808C5FB|nr:sulfite exporter TauE/SafE family protein [Paraburkholderia sp. SARCC-3016]MDQ7981116.1 sulfite exporter TauE/SafE family protein [Paraburkholderia sp. SARCC-3016]
MSLPHIDLLYSAFGLFVGFLVGLTGVGGGSLMTPILVLLFNVHPATAVGTDLLYASVTKATGTLVHGAKGSVEWGVTLRLAAGSVPAATITLILLHRYGMDTPRGSYLIQVVLGAALLITAIALVFRPQLAAFASRHRPAPAYGNTLALTMLTGAVLGALVTLTSVGAGAIGVTVLLLLYPALPVTRIIGSDIAHAVPLTLLAGAGHWLLGSIDWSVLLSLLVGSLPGIVAGSLLSAKAPEKLLRHMLAATLTAVGMRLVLA